MAGKREVFVDTSAWFARVIRNDPDHPAADRWLRENAPPLVTTDYVVGETLTLLKARRQPRMAVALGAEFFGGTLARLYYLTKADIRQAWNVFNQFSDKEWSFTDCTSKVVMEKLGLSKAFAFDQHFHQFGAFSIVP